MDKSNFINCRITRNTINVIEDILRLKNIEKYNNEQRVQIMLAIQEKVDILKFIKPDEKIELIESKRTLLQILKDLLS